MNRRRFLTIASAATAGVAVTGLACASGDTTFDLGLSTLQVPLPRLPAALDGLRIAHVTDLHCGRNVPAAFVSRALDMARQTRADLIVLTGDFVSYDWQNLRAVQEALRALQAPRGVFACLGNHDVFYNRAPHITDILQRCGIRVLHNEALPLDDAGTLWLTGIGDPTTGQHDFDAALRQVPQDACRILIAHAPDIADAAADLALDLALVGHTHGGQVNLPFIGPPVVPSRYGSRFAAGLFDVRGTRLFVSRGVGFVAPVGRYCCPPEVALLTLRRADWSLSTGAPGLDLRPLIRAARGLTHFHRPG
jgi:uncharacterized protein